MERGVGSSLNWMVLMVPAVLASLVLLTLAARIVWRHGRASGDAGGACGRCGYAVRGIAALTCPECGADLREVGIVTRPRSPRAPFVAAAAPWLAFVTIAGSALTVTVHAQWRSGPATAATALAAVALGVAGLSWLRRRLEAPLAHLVVALVLWLAALLGLFLLALRA